MFYLSVRMNRVKTYINSEQFLLETTVISFCFINRMHEVDISCKYEKNDIN